MFVDIETIVLEKIRAGKLFSQQLNEYTNVSKNAHLSQLINVRFVNRDAIREDFVCVKTLATTREEIFCVISKYPENVDFQGENCTSVCTDGAPTTIRHNKDFVCIVTKRNPNVIFAHCFLHREALVSKTLLADLIPVT